MVLKPLKITWVPLGSPENDEIRTSAAPAHSFKVYNDNLYDLLDGSRQVRKGPPWRGDGPWWFRFKSTCNDSAMDVTEKLLSEISQDFGIFYLDEFQCREPMGWCLKFACHQLDTQLLIFADVKSKLWESRGTGCTSWGAEPHPNEAAHMCPELVYCHHTVSCSSFKQINLHIITDHHSWVY